MKYIKHQYQHHHNLHSTGANSATSNGGRSPSLTSSASSKRFKKHSWGARERTGMSFLIVIAFFAIFGIIILTEIFIIDERAHNGLMLRSGGGGYSNRLGDSMPDYDNVKDDYDLIDASLLTDHKFGFVQFQDNKYKIQDVDTNGGGGSIDGSNSRMSGVLINSNSMNNANGGTNGMISASASVIGSGGAASLISWGKIIPNKVEESLPHYPFGMTPTDGSWQIVNGTRFKFFVFSAYYDRRDGGKLIRVVGATKTRGPERVWCRLWYIPANRNITTNGNKNLEQQYKSVTVMARIKVIRENWNLKYSACFVLCPIRPTEYDVPQHVSIVARLRAPPGNLLLLRNTDWDSDFHQNNNTTYTTNSNTSITSPNRMKFSPNEQMPDKLAVCVKPFHFDYDQALFLMEYLEFYALLGVSHFTFYNHTIGQQADCVLQHYIKGDIPDKTTTKPVTMADMKKPKTMAKHVKDNSTLSLSQREGTINDKEQQRKDYNYIRPTVQMLPWNLRMRSQKEIRTEGLFAALNDCLYRTMYRYKYLALVDLDEFIVPRHNDTLIELINSLNSRFRNHNTGAYSFQNAFFYLQFGDDPLVTQIEENESMEMARLRAALVTQRKTRRRFKLHPQKQRSKYICKPEAVVEAGNHFVWEFLPGKGSFNVPPTEAILQHYRVCEFGGNDCIKAPSVLDRTATKYIKTLMERVYEVYKHLKRKCKLPELPPLPKVATPARKIFKPIIRSMNEANNLKPNSKYERNKSDNEMQNQIPNIGDTRRSPMKTIIPTIITTTTISNKLEMKMNTTQRKALVELLTLNNKTITKLTTISNVKTKSDRSSSGATIVTGLANSTTLAASAALHAATTLTAPTTKTAPTIKSKVNRQDSMPNKRKRKVVVFFVDNQGQSRARVEYH